jgi:hypothetical protein
MFWIRLRELSRVKLPILNPTSWASDLLNDRICTKRDMGIILCGMWSVWQSRNDRLHGKTPIELRAAINWTLDICSELFSLKEV